MSHQAKNAERERRGIHWLRLCCVCGSALEWPPHERGIWDRAALSVRREVAIAHAVLRVSTFALGVAAIVS
jgi:hypothetical protein